MLPVCHSGSVNKDTLYGQNQGQPLYPTPFYLTLKEIMGFSQACLREEYIIMDNSYSHVAFTHPLDLFSGCPLPSPY